MNLRRTSLLLALVTATSASAQPVPVPAFQSIEARNGAHVTVRYGPAQRVEVLSGAPKISVTDGRLVIDNYDKHHDARTRVEVVMPRIESLAQAQGGRMTVEAGFPRMAAIALSVAHGGGLDVRQLPIDAATASISNGGLIAVRPSRRLDVAISQGGRVSYWGNPSVTQSIKQGGVVERGAPDEAEGPIWTNGGGDQ